MLKLCKLPIKKLGLSLIVFLILIIQSCKKETPLDPPQPADISATEYSGTPNSNGLLAEIFSENEMVRIRIYGEFNAQGNPQTCQSMTIERVGGDTILNCFLDETGRINALYATFGGGIRDTLFHKFSYLDNDSLAYSVYYYDFQQDSSYLIHFAMGVYQNNVFNGSVIYTRDANGILAWSAGLQAISQTLYNVTGVAVAVGIGILGASIGAPVLGILGTATVMMTWFNNSANASEISHLPGGSSFNSPVNGHPSDLPVEQHLFLSNPRYELASGGPCGKLLYAVADYFKPSGASIDSVKFYGSYLNFDYSCPSGSVAIIHHSFTVSIGFGQLILTGNKIMRWMSDVDPIWNNITSFVPYGYELIGTYQGKRTKSNRATFN